MQLVDAITLIHLPEGPSAYFKLTSFTPAKAISVSRYCVYFISYAHTEYRVMAVSLLTTLN